MTINVIYKGNPTISNTTSDKSSSSGIPSDCCSPRQALASLHEVHIANAPDGATNAELNAELASLCKALGHPARVQILKILMARQSCICGEIVEVMPLAQSTVSEHLRILKKAGLVQGDVDGTRICYCLNPTVLDRLKALIHDI